MKKFLIASVLLGLASPAWAVTTDDVVAAQQKEIDVLMQRLDAVENELMYTHEQRMASSQPTNIIPQETPAQAFERIHSQSQRDEMEQDIEANRNEVFRMEHGY